MAPIPEMTQPTRLLAPYSARAAGSMNTPEAIMLPTTRDVAVVRPTLCTPLDSIKRLNYKKNTRKAYGQGEFGTNKKRRRVRRLHEGVVLTLLRKFVGNNCILEESWYQQELLLLDVFNVCCTDTISPGVNDHRCISIG